MMDTAVVLAHKMRAHADRLRQLETREPDDDIFDVRRFGAIGDGDFHPLSEFFVSLADAQVFYPGATALSNGLDALAIQLALDTAELAGGIVRVPVGRFILDRQLTIEYSNVHLVGEGYATELFSKANWAWQHGALLLIKSADSGVQIRGVVVRDMQLNGNRANQTHNYVTHNIRVNCSDVDEPTRIILKHIWSHDAYSYATHQPVPTISPEAGGISVTCPNHTATERYNQGVLIEGCHSYDNDGWGIGLNYNNGIVISDCHCDGNISMGVTLYASQDCLLDVVHCRENNVNEINLEDCTRVTLGISEGRSTTPLLYASQKSAFKVKNCKDVKAVGCTFVSEVDYEFTYAVLIRGENAGTWKRATENLQLIGCEIYKSGSGRAVHSVHDAGYRAKRIRIEGGTIRQETTTAKHLAVTLGVSGIELVNVYLEGGIELIGASAVADRVAIQGGHIVAAYDTLQNVVSLNNVYLVDIKGLQVYGADNVDAVVSVGNSLARLQLIGNHVFGTIGYFLRAAGGVTLHPYWHGNVINATVTGAITDGNIACPPTAGTWPTNSEVWKSFAAKGYPGGYVYDGANWLPAFGQRGYRSGAATPVGAVTPYFIGEMYLETTTPRWYWATGLADTDWQ